jgi:hypothetical protein
MRDIIVNTDNTISTKLLLPLQMIWMPMEDITTYELALCMPYLLGKHLFMPYNIDTTLPHFRHFKIIDPNIKE